MSDQMLTGVLRMPLPDDPAELDIITWLQFRDRARQSADEIDRLRAENERLREALGLLDEQLDSHGFSVDGPMRRLISHARAALVDLAEANGQTEKE